MRMIILIICLFLTNSCLKKKEIINSNDIEYPTIDNFINNIKKYSLQKNENIVINIELNKLDTTIVFKQKRPNNCVDIKYSMKYKDFNIFIYSSIKDINKLFPSLKNENLCNEFIDTSIEDLPYEEYFIVENNKIVPQY